MVEIQLRYVTRRINKKGAIRWYWQRKGYPLTRLPDNERARAAKALRLNEEADARHEAGMTTDYGTFGWLVPRYRLADRFTKRSKNTRDAYESWLKRIEVDWRDIQVAEVDFRFVTDFLKGIAAKGKTTQLPHAVLKNLFIQAKYEKLISQMPTENVEVKRSGKRDQIWSPDMIEKLMAAARETIGGERLVQAIKILLYTAQRPCDVRAMTWAHWKGNAILVRQQKTGTYLQIWCHTELRAALSAVKKDAVVGMNTIVTDDAGRPISEDRLRYWFDAACVKAGIKGMQTRDFRRTAIVKLAEAGCTVPQIASVSGHSYASVTKILEHYLPRTPELTRSAIEQMERSENEKSNRLDSSAGKNEEISHEIV